MTAGKTIVSVTPLYLDKTGYGPTQKLTRQEWREQCLSKLQAGREAFLAWQQGWPDVAEQVATKAVALDYQLTFADGTTQTQKERQSCVSLDFIGCTFTKTVNCHQYHFLHAACFNHASFASYADFREASFASDANFIEASFASCADFREASFASDADFSTARFKKENRFDAVRFEGVAIFENAQFDIVGHFEAASFKGDFAQIPSFKGCQAAATYLVFSDDRYFTQQDYSQAAIDNISCLKRLSDEHGQTDQALNFNAMELRAKRQLAAQQLAAKQHPDAAQLATLPSWRAFIWLSNGFRGPLWFALFTWLYEVCADFGRSFTRPLVLLLGLNVLTVVICLFVASSNNAMNQSIDAALSEEWQLGRDHNVAISAWRAAAEYSLYKTTNVLDFANRGKRTDIINQRLFGSVIEPSVMRVYGLFKGLLSAILLFLIGLGIRNKYRIG